MEHFEISLKGGKNRPPKKASHTLVGVVASSNLEVLAEAVDLKGRCQLIVDTKAAGFKDTWKAVFQDFVSRSGATDVRFSVNDFSAIPSIVSLRLDQAWEQLNH